MCTPTASIFLKLVIKYGVQRLLGGSLGRGALGSSSGTDSLACVAWRRRCLVLDSKGASASIIICGDVCVIMCVR